MKCTIRNAVLLIAVMVLAFSCSINGVRAAVGWHTIEFQDFTNTDANGWSGGAYSAGAKNYQLVSSGNNLTFVKTLPPVGVPIRFNLNATSTTSAGTYMLLTIQFKSDYGTIQVFSQGSSSGVISQYITDYVVDGAYLVSNSRIEVMLNVSGVPSRSLIVDDFKLDVYADTVEWYDFSASSQGDFWSGGAISGGAYSSSSLSALNFTSRRFFSQPNYIVSAKVSGSFSASASVTFTASIGSKAIYSSTGTSGSFSNYLQYAVMSGSIPFFATSQSGSLTAQSFSIDDVKIIRLSSSPLTVRILSESSRAFYWNSTLSLTYYAYDSLGNAVPYTISAVENEFSFQTPAEAMLVVSAGGSSYQRKIISPARNHSFYIVPVESVIPTAVKIVDYTGLWGSLQRTKVSFYDFTNTILITEAWVDVGYTAYLHPTYLNQYFMSIKSNYASYNFGVYYALTNSVDVAINFAPSGFSTSVNATRIDYNTIRVYYYDPQNLTYNVSLTVKNIFGSTIYQDTQTTPISTWTVGNCSNTVPTIVNVSAYMQTNKGVERKEWAIVLPLTNSSSNIMNTTTPALAPPFGLSFSIGGFPMLGAAVLLTMMALVFQFPSPYLRYAVLLCGGVAFFLSYSNWLPSIPPLGWSAVGVVCVVYAFMMKRRR